MNLTYTTTATGYIIYNNGVAWIRQEGYIPPEFIDPNDTSFARSAELNIAWLIEANKPVPPEPTIAELQAQIDDLYSMALPTIPSEPEV
jgi:hypothetical protein